MRLARARVQNYRSVRDTDWFDVESLKTILVGPNEAGKSAILQALQQLNAPPEVPKLEALRDYPRDSLNDIQKGRVKPGETPVVTGEFVLEPDDLSTLPSADESWRYQVTVFLDNSWTAALLGPSEVTYADLRTDLVKLSSRALAAAKDAEEGAPKPLTVDDLTKGWEEADVLDQARRALLAKWLDSIVPLFADGSSEEARIEGVRQVMRTQAEFEEARDALTDRLPVFVLFNNYFRVRPIIHLAHLAERLKSGVLDDSHYDYGNKCLLDLLGFTAKELSDLGRANEPPATDPNALKDYRDRLDARQYQLNAAAVRLTKELRSIWNPDEGKAEADNLKLIVDGQYLKVVVEDALDAQIELHQRSEGFQWLVSFFVVFFAEAADKHQNAVLLLDEPGLSLHGLKQREFQKTLSRLAEQNQTIYTTHSPFLVGPGELDLVRVVEMTDRKVGTQVHTQITGTGDPAALLPLQEALGYDLANSLFAQKRNLVLEGLTDYWYVDSLSALLEEAELARLDERIAKVPADSASKVVYFATILHAHKLKVAALLDSDAAGDSAATQDVLVHRLGNKRILRTKDAYSGQVKRPEIEDLLRETLIGIAKAECGWDVGDAAAAQPGRPIVDLFAEVEGFSKYRLAKAFLRWSRDHKASDLTETELKDTASLIAAINSALK